MYKYMAVSIWSSASEPEKVKLFALGPSGPGLYGPPLGTFGLGSYGPGPYGLPWALMSLVLMGRALIMGPHVPLWAGP